MKNTLKILLLITLLTFILCGCEDYKAKNGETETTGPSDEIYAYVITFLSDGNGNREWRLLNSYIMPYPEAHQPSGYSIDGVAMVPLEVLAKVFDYSVEYEETAKEILITKNDTNEQMVCIIGSNTVYINDKKDEMPQSPIIHDSKIFAPIRYVSECFGYYVYEEWVDSFNQFDVWVSVIPLLEEVDVEYNEQDYNEIEVEGYPYPDYSLKEGAETNRGIRLGDTYQKVIEAYGEPYVGPSEYGGNINIVYATPMYPGKGAGTFMEFAFQGDILVRVTISFGP